MQKEGEHKHVIGKGEGRWERQIGCLVSSRAYCQEQTGVPLLKGQGFLKPPRSQNIDKQLMSFSVGTF